MGRVVQIPLTRCCSKIPKTLSPNCAKINNALKSVSNVLEILNNVLERSLPPFIDRTSQTAERFVNNQDL
ncbi:hypothetical protein QJS04_geneDACA011209 [Acorus gramineus]|uniref:Uncharacterized protein n=1 Tax=Acorus gramineus TaxID=55184 RepID=A0AAV9AMZ4_ACOGR|nr:hypothetical protein QJS04_geneDACA011209 [Acorus gramineus]